MGKKTLYGIIVIVLIAAGWYWYAGQGGSAVAPSATLNADAYPLRRDVGSDSGNK